MPRWFIDFIKDCIFLCVLLLSRYLIAGYHINAIVLAVCEGRYLPQSVLRFQKSSIKLNLLF